MSGATTTAHYPAGAVSRLGIQAAVYRESLRPFAAMNARPPAAMSRGHQHLISECCGGTPGPLCPPPSPAGRGVRIARRLGYGFPMARSYHVFGDIAAKLAVAPNKKSPASAGLVCLVHLPACKLRRSTRCGTITSRPR